MTEAHKADIQLRDVEIKGFRGIAEGKLEGLSGLNVLVGRNDVGKSTILEALYLASTGCDMDILGHVPLEYTVTRRGWFGLPSVSGLFLKDQKSCKISINFKDDARLEFLLQIDIPLSAHLEPLSLRGLNTEKLATIYSRTDGLFSRHYTHYFDSEGKYHMFREKEEGDVIKTLLLDWNDVSSYGGPEDYYSVMMDVGGIDSKEMLLKILGERYGIKDLSILKKDNNWILYIIYEDRRVPIYLIGDGLRLALAYLMLLSAASEALLLLEEPELHQHPGLLELVAEAIVRSDKERNCQVILSTHSVEFIDVLLSKAEKLNALDDLSIYRISLIQSKLKVKRYTAEEARSLRKELEFDLRR